MTAIFDILYRPHRAWAIRADAAEGASGEFLTRGGEPLPVVGARDHAPGDCDGAIVSVRPAGHPWTAADLDGRRVLTVELDDAALAAARSGRLKVASGGLSETTFADRFGVVAGAMIARFGSEEAALLAESGAGGDAESGFALALEDALGAVPRTVCHTGLGLYEVGPGKAYSTIQSAVDALWTHQGSAEFGAKQVIRVFAGVYAESVAPNLSLNPAAFRGNAFILEGDPSADRSEVVIRPGPISYAFFWTKDARIRHLTVEGAAGVIAAVRVQNRVLEISDCRVDAPEATAVMVDYGRIEDCDIRQASASGYGVRGNSAGSIDIRRTRLTGQGSSYGVNGWGQGRLNVEACEFLGWLRGVGAQYTFLIHQLTIRNCLFVGCSEAAISYDTSGAAGPVFENNIFVGCAVIHGGPTLAGGPPDVTANREGKPQVWRNNVFSDYTHFAQHLGSGAGDWVSVDWPTYRSYALVTESGNLDGVDPLFVDPASGDYGLQPTSPCRWSGVGAGVTRGVNGVAFDERSPDIGARSSGPKPEAELPDAPEITVTVAGSELAVDLRGGGLAEHHAALVFARTGETADHASRPAEGPVALHAPAVGERYTVIGWCENEAGRSKPAAPVAVFVPGAGGPAEAIRAWLVGMMREHAGLAAILGTGPAGEAPVYSGSPPLPERMPSVSVEVTTAPDARLSPPGRHEARIEVAVAARTHAEADAVSSALDELLASGGSATVAGWTVKRVIRERANLRAETRPHEGGRGMVRRLVWSASVDPS